ncbi:MAG: FAD-binding oxidoreductase [Ignavibacterium sp.]|jgi:D-lactate dehydrogenase (cytochrome)|nr:MAG: FAD-binding oxidoreductase [Ignavibacterium sp.]MDD5608609.1 FAD-binding oxidoreductase [Ignavibacterium sp.]MDX9712441.1 FAD-binding oxidoreductase [Ignavibacteriaceae bacterium]MEB2355013.1 FAD-binding oxidoreductase [Ignavibacteriales bacterium]GIK21860.1 MAG: FAD-linked oxidase [Ignavibacteriota bacterium]
MIIKTNPDEFENYLVDASNFKGNCEAVYFPENSYEIVWIIKEANKNKFTVTTAGNRTGLTGACIPQNGIVIATDRLNKIIEINQKQFYALVEPAVLLSDFQKELKQHKLFYPPDPTETNCYIGGTVATNASGAKTFKYGPTRNYVIGLQIVLPDGEVIDLERGKQKANGYKLTLSTQAGKNINLNIPDYTFPKVKNASGYFVQKDMDAIDLLIGSEGTLGIITKIKLKLLPQPEDTISCVLFFEDERNALKFLEEARDISYQNKKSSINNNVNALALEFFDERALRFLSKDFSAIPDKAKAAIWFEQESTSDDFDSILEAWNFLMQTNNVNEETAWFAFSNADKEKIKDFRHAISWKVNDYIARNNFRKLGTDVAVPDKVFSEFYLTLQGWAKQSKIDFVAYGHFGNSHIHLNFLPKDDDEFNEAKKIYRQICEEAVRLGGTISAEHGIGKTKRDYLLMMYGEANIRKMAELKKSLDPNLILGIGNIFDDRFLA